MKKSLATAAVFGLGFVGLAATASAQNYGGNGQTFDKGDGGYASLKGGAQFLDDPDYRVGASNVKSKMDTGALGSAAIGMRHGPFRGEIEGLYSESDDKSNNVSGVGSANSDGKTKLTAAMGNAYYDIANVKGFVPYVGGGVGYGHVKFDNYRANGANLVDKSDNVLAYQGIAGVSYQINPCWDLTAEYRYIGTQDASVRTSAGNKTDISYDSNNVLVGARYNF